MFDSFFFPRIQVLYALKEFSLSSGIVIQDGKVRLTLWIDILLYLAELRHVMYCLAYYEVFLKSASTNFFLIFGVSVFASQLRLFFFWKIRSPVDRG